MNVNNAGTHIWCVLKNSNVSYKGNVSTSLSTYEKQKHITHKAFQCVLLYENFDAVNNKNRLGWCLLTLGAHAQKGLRYLTGVFVCVCVKSF